MPGSRYVLDQSPCPRISVQATLVSRKEGKLFTFANTHLDHVGAYARLCGASLLMTKLLSENKYPFILTGDFNALPDEASIKEIKNLKGVHDLTAAIKETTYHGYGKETGYKIDYIFSNKTAVKGTLTVHKDKKGEVWLSDHYPISVTVDIH